MKRLLLIPLLALSLLGQGVITITATTQGKIGSPRYQISKDTTGTESSVVTVQQLAATAASKTLYFEEATVSCLAACTFTVEQNGTAATATAGTIKSINNSPTATATAWTGSNVGTGSFVSQTFNVPATGNVTVDLSKFQIGTNAGTGGNVTIRAAAAAMTTVSVHIQWTEQ
jgi:hypothetical protein